MLFRSTPSNSFLANQWNHVVFTRNSSNNLAVFINGTRQYYTASNTYNYGLLSGTLGIGIAETGRSGYYFGGYISNFRLFKSAYYDPTQTTITVPTTALTAVSGTALLTCQSNRFIDNSTNAFAISVAGGTPSVQRFSPFNPTASYDTATIGGSGYFEIGRAHV